MDAMRSTRTELSMLARGRTPTHAHLRTRLFGLTSVTIAVDLVAGALALALERHAPGTGITDYGDALFWTSGQLLTVSSQLPNPLTGAGRVLDVFLEAYAISIVAVLAGSLGAFFHRRGMERDPIQVPDDG